MLQTSNENAEGLVYVANPKHQTPNLEPQTPNIFPHLLVLSLQIPHFRAEIYFSFIQFLGCDRE